ncbi:methylated-DNA--[protein]-cysteine S-methyltransferase [Paracoccus sp. N5]|uniref:methylated-DNA--[protein]-cysteine S-methyltransferase n=1 Tax=Paracoccus sp. N5 TaxID=1101189 RepID=UPI00037C55D3|nr:methylated-DNA--[protein]-cysteine S-methyltransferase [Paracoccus sp. N5]
MAIPADPAAELARLIGPPPGTVRLAAHWFATPLGAMVAVADGGALHLLEFADRPELGAELRRLAAESGGIAPGCTPVTELTTARLAAWFHGARRDFDLPLAAWGTPFQRRVWQELCRIPAGTTLSYGALARRIGQPRAVRAVARANGANRLALVIPCHRILGADGALTGYGGGLWRKQALLRHESGGPLLPQPAFAGDFPAEKA